MDCNSRNGVIGHRVAVLNHWDVMAKESKMEIEQRIINREVERD